jgi:hypothetical protein
VKENDLHRQVGQLLDQLKWFWWHTPNGGSRHQIEARRFKGLGVKRGVADIVIAEPWFCPDCFDSNPDCPICFGVRRGSMVALELKSPTGRLTRDQQAWLTEAQKRGWLCGVARSLDEVIRILRCVRPVNGRTLQRGMT